MSIRSRVTRNGHHEPVLTVTVVGAHDVYRFAAHMTRGQCEFAARGFSAMRGLRRQMGKAGHDWLHRYMHGDGGFS